MAYAVQIAHEALTMPDEGHRVRGEAVQTGHKALKSSSRSDGLNLAVDVCPRKGWINRPRRVATTDHCDADPIVADATRLFGLTHRGLKPTAKVTRRSATDLVLTSRSDGLNLAVDVCPRSRYK